MQHEQIDDQEADEAGDQGRPRGERGVHAGVRLADQLDRAGVTRAELVLDRHVQVPEGLELARAA